MIRNILYFTLLAPKSYTLATRVMHLRHSKGTLGDAFHVMKLKTADLQDHMTRRSKAFGIRKRKLSDDLAANPKFRTGRSLGSIMSARRC